MIRSLLTAVLLAPLGAVPARAEELSIRGTAIDIRPKPDGSVSPAVRQWIENSAKAVATYYGGIPVKRVVLRVTTTEGRKARNGRAGDDGGLSVDISVGREATNATLADDWILTHEMLHLCFPSVPQKSHWLEEGISTYVEPFARARAGLITPEAAWAGLVEGAPEGQPREGDHGLDNTHTWGRTYWGGAIFCLRADVEIRKRTGNKKGLEHALRAIAASGGTLDKFWKLDQVIAVGDGATGVPVLRELYDEMKGQPVTVDLAGLWKELGVEAHGKSVVFHDDAPLAGIRKAITAP